MQPDVQIAVPVKPSGQTAEPSHCSVPFCVPSPQYPPLITLTIVQELQDAQNAPYAGAMPFEHSVFVFLPEP